MVAGKVKQAMGLTTKQPKPKPKPPPPPPPSSATKSSPTHAFNRSFGAYFPRASAQVGPRPPEVSVAELLKLVDELRERESHLKTELRETVSLKHVVDKLLSRLAELEAENEKLVSERQVIKAAFEAEVRDKDLKIVELMAEVEEVKQLSSSHRFQGLVEVANKSNLIKNLSSRKSPSFTSSSINNNNNINNAVKFEEIPVELTTNCRSNSGEEIEITSVSPSLHCRVPRVPKPPPNRCLSDSSSSVLFGRKLTDNVSPPAIKSAPPPPPPPPPGPAMKKSPAASTSPPPPPPAPMIGGKFMTGKVKRVPEVVEFYHSLMRRDTRRESGVGVAETTATTSARDLVGEIENRSAYLIAIKTDVETQGDFIRFLIKEVETAAFTDIEDVVSFVKWLDDELSYLVDERAVLKHFDWPEQKADGLREAAFEYSDLKKLESEASSFRHDTRQACSTTLKKMQTLLEKLEHGVYNLSRLRESATNRFKSFHIPIDWMLDNGFVSQIKLASVKLAMKYMKRVLAELEIVGGGPEEEELIVQGVRFAFRVHQFAGGFNVETMMAFEELRDKARSFHVQCQKKQQPRLACRS